MGTGRLIKLYASETLESIDLPPFRVVFQKDAPMSQFAAKEGPPTRPTSTQEKPLRPTSAYCRCKCAALRETTRPARCRSFRRPPSCHFNDRLLHVISATEGRRNLSVPPHRPTLPRPAPHHPALSRQTEPAPPGLAMVCERISRSQRRHTCNCGKRR